MKNMLRRLLVLSTILISQTSLSAASWHAKDFTKHIETMLKDMKSAVASAADGDAKALAKAVTDTMTANNATGKTATGGLNVLGGKRRALWLALDEAIADKADKLTDAEKSDFNDNVYDSKLLPCVMSEGQIEANKKGGKEGSGMLHAKGFHHRKGKAPAKAATKTPTPTGTIKGDVFKANVAAAIADINNKLGPAKNAIATAEGVIDAIETKKPTIYTQAYDILGDSGAKSPEKAYKDVDDGDKEVKKLQALVVGVNDADDVKASEDAKIAPIKTKALAHAKAASDKAGLATTEAAKPEPGAGGGGGGAGKLPDPVSVKVADRAGLQTAVGAATKGDLDAWLPKLVKALTDFHNNETTAKDPLFGTLLAELKKTLKDKGFGVKDLKEITKLEPFHGGVTPKAWAKV